MNYTISKTRLFLAPMVAVAFTAAAYAAAPGIASVSGSPIFNLQASTAYITQPDGQAVYSWGYGCTTGATPAPTFLPSNIPGNCPTMQIPGPTLIVTEGDVVTVNLTNNLPTAAGNTSILFPGFNVIATGGAAGLLTQEAAPGGTVTYKFTASTAGTRAYYSGTQGDLQVEMGLYGAVIVLPKTIPGNCDSGLAVSNMTAQTKWGESDFRLAHAAYNHPNACYDREYLFQFSEMDPDIHHQVQAQVQATAGCLAGALGCSLQVATEPYHPAYFMINGRSMPDDMDANYIPAYPHQPYNGNPHMHPGEQVLIRVIGQGRWQHPFHEHGNHVRILGRDGNLIISKTDPNSLAGPLLFTTTTTPGLAFDGIFYWTGKGLNWDAYGHKPASAGLNTNPPRSTTLSQAVTLTATSIVVANVTGIATGSLLMIDNEQMTVVSVTVATRTLGVTRAANGTTVATHTSGTAVAANLNFNPNGNTTSSTANDELPCVPDANGYNTGAPTAINYYEWCQDHNKPVEATPLGDIAGGGPVTLPNPNIFTNGAWYGGSPYLGPDATLRAVGPTGVTPPSGTIANPPSTEAGFAFMWHSHNEREITTNNAFPGGMLMMMLVDSREFKIDESN